MKVSLLLAMVWALPRKSSGTIELEMISLLPKTIPIAPALPYTLPALELATEMVNSVYFPHIHMSVKLIFNTSHKECVVANADNPGALADYFYASREKKCYAVVGSICGGLDEAANLAKAWNILLFSNGLVEQKSFNNLRCPTAVSLGGAIESYAAMVLKLLEENTWIHVSVFAVSSGVTFYELLGKALVDKSKQSVQRFSLELTMFTESHPTETSHFLENAKLKSRVIFLLANTNSAVKVLAIAQSLNMTTNEYVYFVIQPLEQDLYGKVILLTKAKAIARDTLKTIVYVTARQSDDSVAALNRQLVNRTLSHSNSNITYPNGTQPLDNFSLRAAYDSIELFARMVNESSDFGDNVTSCDGKKFASQLAGRNMVLKTGPTHITPDGTRILDLDIYGYNSVHDQMKIVRWFNSVDNTLPWLLNSTGQFSPLLFPPPAVPVCGFSGKSGPCSTDQTLTTIVAPVVAAFVVVVLVGAYAARRLHRNSNHNDRWWLIHESELHFQTAFEPCKAEWKEKAVWITPAVTANSFSVDSLLRFSVLQQLRSVHHANITTFLGISFVSSKAYLISEYCQRGALPDLQRAMSLDWDFKFSLLRDLVQALWFIHHSPLKHHGTLTVRKCLIDSRFTLKVGSLRYEALRAFLDRDRRASTKPARIPLAQSLKHRDVIQREDILALGIIASDFLELKASSELTKDPVRSDPKFIGLTALFLSCKVEDPLMRPWIDVIKKGLETFSGANNQDVVSLVMNRVQKYTEVLEDAVAEKTKELVYEQAKCDDLLKEMLPPSIVGALRNKVVVEPEYFDCVTISFSDLPGFVSWVTSVSPYDVIKMLNRIYSLFDDEIGVHDLVQKIETISDCYVVASGVPVRNENRHAAAVCQLAKSLQRVFTSSKLDEKGLSLRVGIHSDHCAASVIGSKVPRYCLCGRMKTPAGFFCASMSFSQEWINVELVSCDGAEMKRYGFGDAMNTASRMESHGEGNKIHLSYKTAELITGNDDLICRSRGKITVKGKGEMETFWLTSR